jgi:hypothetical protein
MHCWLISTQLITNDTEQLSTVIEGIEYITQVTKRYQIIESHIRNTQNFHNALQEAIMKLYRSILEFQASAACYFSRKTLSRFLRNIPKLDDWTGMLKVIREADQNCNSFMQLQGTIELRKSSDEVSENVDRILKLTNTENQSYEKTAVKIMRHVSSLPVEDYHVAVRRNLGPAYWQSGQWLWGRSE